MAHPVSAAFFKQSSTQLDGTVGLERLAEHLDHYLPPPNYFLFGLVYGTLSIGDLLCTRE